MSPGAAVDDNLARAWRLLMSVVLDQRFRWAEVAAELGISQAGLRALLAIDPGAPRPMRDLADAMNCDASYVTVVVDDLEQAGYAQRRPGDHDRRIKIVALTDAGVTALQRAQDGLMAPPAQLVRMPPDQQQALARLLQDALSGS